MDNDALIRANHRALDLQYALDSEIAQHQPIKLSDRLPDEGADALFYMPGFSWERGELRYLEDIVYGRVPYVYERHGNRYRASEYTHWLPLPPDPTD